VKFLEDYRQDLCGILGRIDLARIRQAIDWLAEARDQGRTVFTCGNGGSAATASHFACDLLKGASYNRARRWRVICLVDQMPTISAYANDVNYAAIFAEQLRNFAAAGDLLLAISGSGNSANVVGAAEYARSVGARTIGLTGRDGGQLGRRVDLNILVPVQHMGLIEDAHLVICHMMGYWFMESEETRP
jgi:D-sedoheptulose 7-phosphate isomerase